MVPFIGLQYLLIYIGPVTLGRAQMTTFLFSWNWIFSKDAFSDFFSEYQAEAQTMLVEHKGINLISVMVVD